MNFYIYVLICIAIIALAMWAQHQKEKNDPYRLDDMFRQSGSCDSANHEYCGYPGPLYFSLNGICECRCHDKTSHSDLLP